MDSGNMPDGLPIRLGGPPDAFARYATRSPPLELHGEDSVIKLAAPDFGEARQHPQHWTVVGQNVGDEAPEIPGLGRLQQVVEQQPTQTTALPGVFDHDGNLGGAGRLAGLVASHGMQDRLTVLSLFGDQGQARVIVHVGEAAIPGSGQPVQGAKESLVHGAGTQTIEHILQAVLVVRADRAHSQRGTVGQLERTDELPRVVGHDQRIHRGDRAHLESGPKAYASVGDGSPTPASENVGRRRSAARAVTKATAAATTSGARKMRRWPSPSVIKISAPRQARTVAMPCCQGTSASPRSWITSKGVWSIGAMVVTSKADQGWLTRVSMRCRMCSLTAFEIGRASCRRAVESVR